MKQKILLAIMLLLLLAACAQSAPEALPTLAPVANVPTAAPATPTGLPPTRDLSTVAATPLPTAVPPTGVPTVTATPVDPGINLTSPDEDAQIVLGSDIVVRGLAQLDADQRVVVELVSATNRLLASGEAVLSDVGWQAGLSVPDFVSGAGELRATIIDADGTGLVQDKVSVALALNTETADRFLALSQPLSGETAVAGYFLFFEGRVRRPAGNAVTLSLWMDNCQLEVAKFTLSLGGSGAWRGSLGIPGDVAGPGCAVATFGTPGEENWREAQIPVTVFAADDPSAGGVQLASPPPNSSVSAGGELYVAGTAFNADSVRISVEMDNSRIVAEQTVFPDPFGNWELTVLLPFDIEGSAIIVITALDGAGNPRAEAQTIVTVNSAPTPTPIPVATAEPTPTP